MCVSKCVYVTVKFMGWWIETKEDRLSLVVVMLLIIY